MKNIQEYFRCSRSKWFGILDDQMSWSGAGQDYRNDSMISELYSLIPE